MSGDAETRGGDAPVRLRALRGAITVARDEAELVHDAVRELVTTLAEQNGIAPDDVVSVIFTATDDLHSTFPAAGARAVPGWGQVPVLCARELAIEGALPRCIRVLMHVYLPCRAVQHAYLRDARQLRPDLAS